nr:MAG TPA: DNA-directed RNA polymerase [Caudoviricetes sp.]
MAEYIDRAALDKALTIAAASGKDKDRRTWAKAICVLHDMPAADVVPVAHGEWIPISDGEWAECSECGEGYEVSDNGGMTAFKLFCEFYKYCPNCGAKMDRGDSDEVN